MTKISKPLIRRTVEVYIDDIVIKNKTHAEHVHHLEKVFGLMWKYNMKLNLLKYAFGVSMGKFLGFLVTQKEIEINLDQVKFMLETPVPSIKKEIQWLTGYLAVLGRFIAWFINKLNPFFTTLRGAQTFSWTEECKSVFDCIKQYLTKPPILSSPNMGEELYMYLAISDYIVCTIFF